MVDELSLEQAEQVNGSYSLEIKEDGVFLIVIAARGLGNAVTETTILDDLKSKNITSFNQSLIIQAVREATGIPVKVAERVEQTEPEITLHISRDKMEVVLQIIVKSDSKPVQMEKIMEKINSSGVVFGIHEDEIKKAYDHPGLEVVCATGQPAVDGKNAVIIYHFNLEEKGRPVLAEDGRVDYKNLNMFTIVNNGDLLAEKVPATEGTLGSDVMGTKLYPKPGRDVPLPVGKNVKVVECTKLVADISGQLILVNNKVHVMPVIEIKEDVDLSTGNIDFIGNVIIRGSVQTGFTVKAEGDVEINGTVSGGIVEGKNVIVKMGVQGMHRGHIKATENVISKFIENATINAGNQVLVSEVILHSRVCAGKQVIVEGKRGVITGGVVVAGEEIRAKTVGTPMNTATELEVGVNPMLREEFQEIRKGIKQKEVSLDQTQKALQVLRSMNQQTMPPEKREMLLKLTKAQFHLVGQVETMRNRLETIEMELEEMRNGKIKVLETVYPGVKITVGTYIKQIRENMKFVTFYAEDGDVKVNPYK